MPRKASASIALLFASLAVAPVASAQAPLRVRAVDAAGNAGSAGAAPLLRR